MGLKCRLLGHQYGDPEIEREREENGDEVVVTIREIQVCQRCGEEHVVTENKEVTSIRSPADVGLDETPGDTGDAAAPPTAEERPSGPETARDDAATQIPEAEPDAETAAASDAETADAPTEAESESGAFDDDDFEPPEDPDDDDAVILGDEASERDETQWPDEPGPDPQTAAQESAAVEGGDAAVDRTEDEDVTDDAEFIDADVDAGTRSDDEATDRARGEWPEREAPDDREAAWPVQEGEDEGFAAEPSDGAPTDVSFGGLAPETNGRADHDEEGDYVAVNDEGFARAEQRSELQSDVPDDRIEFYCPNCGHARTAGASSMRAGDICPKCKQGYIAEREL